MLLFCEVLCTDSEFVDFLAVVQVEPELDVIFVAEKIWFDLAEMVDLVSGQLREKFLFQGVSFVDSSSFFFISD
jgi:hypothetical protein